MHCTAGKDRTGVIIALTLGAAGVPHREIIEDFARSAEYLAPIYEELREHTARGRTPGAPNREWILGSRPETMGDTLTYLDGAYGGVQGYLETIGLTDGERAALSSLLAG